MARWAGQRTVYLVVDGAYAGRAVLEDRPPNVQVVSRLRWDAALYTCPLPRRPGQEGRPRRRGDRLPALQQLTARRRRWTALPLVLYGRAVRPRIATFTALWYGALRTQPVRIVVVRHPSGRRRDEACFCTDLGRDAAFLLQTYAHRWTLEVTFYASKRHLGFGQAQTQTPTAVQRTVPFAGPAYSLVLLWAAAHVQQGGTLSWVTTRGAAPSRPSSPRICSWHSARNCGGLAFPRADCFAAPPKTSADSPVTFSHSPPHNGGTRG